MDNTIFNKIITENLNIKNKTIKYNQKFKNYEFQNKLDHTDGKIALWQSVIMQAILDISANPKKLRDKVERQKTISWFSESNEDFITVCTLAYLSPKFVLNGFKYVMKNNKNNIKNKSKKNNKNQSKEIFTTKTKDIYKFTA